MAVQAVPTPIVPLSSTVAVPAVPTPFVVFPSTVAVPAVSTLDSMFPSTVVVSAVPTRAAASSLQVQTVAQVNAQLRTALFKVPAFAKST